MSWFNPRSAKGEDPASLPTLTPQRDETFMQSPESALRGELPVYYAAVPLSACVPFDLDYRPDLHPAGAAAIEKATAACPSGKFEKLIVYQRGAWFIVSDDYIHVFAALQGLPDYVACKVLGKPEGNLVQGVQGPLAVEGVGALFFGSA